MRCVIYKSERRRATYLYVEHEDDFARVPMSLLRTIGRLVHVMTLDLTAKRRLAQADPNEVRRQLRQQGYYLQLPPSHLPGGGVSGSEAPCRE